MASNMQKIGYVALVVRDYDEALAFYTGVLGFDLIEVYWFSVKWNSASCE